MPWVYTALFSLLSFGLWGFFSKLTVNYVDARTALLYQTIGVVIIGLFTWYTIDFKLTTHPKGMLFGVLTGITYGLGCLFYFVAAIRGPVTSVVTLTALYPLVTIVLAFLLLHEGINIKQGFGIVFAIIAMVCFAG